MTHPPVLLMSLLLTLALFAIVGWGIFNAWRGDRRRKQALYVRDILVHIYGVLRNPKAPIVLAHENKTTAGAIFSARNFFCDCMWPMRSSAMESGDNGGAILRTLDGYIGLAESSALQEHLGDFSVYGECDATLKFLIEEDAGGDAAVRKQHGIYCKVDVEHASGIITPVISGILPQAILETVDADRLIEEIFVTLQAPNKG